jgi:hypothetical protein
MASGLIDRDQIGSAEIRSRAGRPYRDAGNDSWISVELYRSSDGVAVSNISQHRAERRSLPSWDAAAAKPNSFSIGLV